MVSSGEVDPRLGRVMAGRFQLPGAGPNLRTRLSAVEVLIVNVKLDLGTMKG